MIRHIYVHKQTNTWTKQIHKERKKAKVWKDLSVTWLKDCCLFVPREMRFLIGLSAQILSVQREKQNQIMQQTE